MTEHLREIDETTQQLLRETYNRVQPSPEFRRRLFQQLKMEAQAGRSFAGWWQRIRSTLTIPAGSGWSWSRREVTSAVLALALLLLLVGSAVWAMRDRAEDVPATAPAPTQQLPSAIHTPTVRPAPPTPTVNDVEQDQPLTAPLPETDAPTSNSETLTVRPSDVPPPRLPNTRTPTPQPIAATALPTATPMPTSTEAASPAVPTLIKPENSPVPPTAVSTTCEGARIMGVARVDIDGDGRVSQGDVPLAGVTVTLQDNATQQVIGRVTTGADGGYVFDTLEAGLYTLQAVPPAGYQAITGERWGVDLECVTIERDFLYRAEQGQP